MQKLIRIGVVLVGVLCVLQSAWGQEVTASITGTVTDPSGAAVTGATVTATSQERGLTYAATSNDSGRGLSRNQKGRGAPKVYAVRDAPGGFSGAA